MTNFRGINKKVTAQDVERAAAFLKCSPAAIRAVMDVETSGGGFDSMGNVKFLFEPHRFYAEIKPDSVILKKAILSGLAYPAWKGPGSYPKTVELRWKQFQRACELDETAAIRAASWGLGQIMGSEYAEAGYTSPQQMVESFALGESEQLFGMCELIKARNLDLQLRKFPDINACRAFALRYNGKAYEKNQYHTKLQSAYNRWAERLKTNEPIVADDGILRVGSKGERVQALQQTLKDKGYKGVGKIDGKFGRDTRDAVNAWKSDHGKSPNGQMNQEDLLDLENSPKRTVDPERGEATVEALKPESSIVRDTDTSKKVGASTGLVLGGAEVAQKTGLLDQAQDYADKAERVGGVVDTVKGFLDDWGITDLLSFIVDYKFPILCVVLAVLVFYMFRIQKARVQMHQEREVA